LLGVGEGFLVVGVGEGFLVVGVGEGFLVVGVGEGFLVVGVGEGFLVVGVAPVALFNIPGNSVPRATKKTLREIRPMSDMVSKGN